MTGCGQLIWVNPLATKIVEFSGLMTATDARTGAKRVCHEDCPVVSDARQRASMAGSSHAHRHVRHTAPFALLAGMVPDIVKRALVRKRFSGKRRSTGDGPLHLVDVAVSDFRL